MTGESSPPLAALPTPEPSVLWRPSQERASASALARYLDWLGKARGLHFADYDEAWRWSVTSLDEFWTSIGEFFEVIADGEWRPALAGTRMPDARWFPGLALNYAENALRGPEHERVVIARDETGAREELTRGELRRRVGKLRAHFVRAGVTRGDRVVAVLPNGTAALVAFLATASIGAIWSSCPPEFGPSAVLDRFRQIEPKLLVAVGSSVYGGKRFSRAAEIAAIIAGLPTLESIVTVGTEPLDAGRLPVTSYDMAIAADAVAGDEPLGFVRVPFEHPLWILYSSGTTGLPKAIVHGHGGIVLEHLKVLALQGDIGRGDRFFWFSTTGWMMWNYLAGGLLVGATLVLYDGSPTHPDLGALWKLAAAERVTYFGGGAAYFMACRKARLVPREKYDLGALRSVGSTASPLPSAGFEWIYECVKADVLVASVSGGTDLCTAFVGSCPLLPVALGELQCRALGAKVEAYDENGESVIGSVGELVITEPMPSMPVKFWGDADGARYRDSYFSKYPGVWRHGDWIAITERGSAVISGRSDSTLNRGGVRMGTSEFYRVVEAIDGISDSLVIDAQDGLWLFVAAQAEGKAEIITRIRSTLRAELSPRHVPDHVVFVRAIPRTLSGKKLEVPVKRMLAGARLEDAANPGTLQDPSALVECVEAAMRRRGPPAT